MKIETISIPKEVITLTPDEQWNLIQKWNSNIMEKDMAHSSAKRVTGITVHYEVANGMSGESRYDVEMREK